jgi:hypothetical protein
MRQGVAPIAAEEKLNAMILADPVMNCRRFIADLAPCLSPTVDNFGPEVQGIECASWVKTRRAQVEQI